jgi:hypothetical protein
MPLKKSCVKSASVAAENDNVPAQVPVRRLVNLSASISNEVPPLAPASPQPSLGIFSGKPARDDAAQPAIFATADDRSSPEDDELFKRWMRWVDG